MTLLDRSVGVAHMYICMWAWHICTFVCGRGTYVHLYVGVAHMYICMWAWHVYTYIPYTLRELRDESGIPNHMVVT